MKTVKDILKTSSDFIAKHGITIIAVLLCITFFLFSSLAKDIKHASEIHKLQLENLELSHEMQDIFDFSQEQAKVSQAKENKLEEASAIIQNQSIWLQRMMERLKELKAWPLTVKPIDPDTAI